MGKYINRNWYKRISNNERNDKNVCSSKIIKSNVEDCRVNVSRGRTAEFELKIVNKEMSVINLIRSYTIICKNHICILDQNLDR